MHDQFSQTKKGGRRIFKHTQNNHLDLQIKKSPQSTTKVNSINRSETKKMENSNSQIINQSTKKSPQSTSFAGPVCVGGCWQTAGSPSWVMKIFIFNFHFHSYFGPSWVVKIFRFSIFNFNFYFG